MDRERAGIHVADRVDQAHDASGAAQVQPRQRVAVRREVEERVARQYTLAVRDQPVVQLTLLLLGGVQFVPHVGAATRRPQARDAQRRTEPVGELLELVELAHVLAGDYNGDLGILEPRLGEILQRTHGHRERTRPAHSVVHLGGRAVERDLDVDVIAGRQARGDLLVDLDAVGGELDTDLVLGRVVDQLPEVGADGGLTAADVDVEDLHALQLVDDRLALFGAELARVPASRGRQAVHARQVARVGEFPREADRGVETEFELVYETTDLGDERSGGRRRGRGRLEN